jgi:CRP-like cAMP-binding protein
LFATERRSSPLGNDLLDALSPQDLALIEPHLDPVDLRARDVIERSGVPIDYVHFPRNAVASVLAGAVSDRRLEIGIVGRDGMTGIALLLGEDAPQNDTFVQVSGVSLRIRATELRAAIAASATFQSSLLRYVYAFLVQSARTTLANGHWRIEQRLARRLLLFHDRIAGDSIFFTHEFLAMAMGAARPSITLALHLLEQRGAIRSRRSEITILDRSRLVELARGCYDLLEEGHRPIATLPPKN